MSRSFTLCHTADWHLGHALHGRSRETEHAAFLAWLIDLLAGRGVDALIVAGDVFDAASPPGSALAAFYGFLAELRRRAPAIDVVVIAGNHDSPSRIEAPDPLLRSLGVRMIGVVPWVGRGRAQAIDPDPLVVPLHARGQVVAQVAAVPYLRACDLPAFEGGDRAEEPAARIARGARHVYETVAARARERLGPGQALIVTGHCYVAGAALSDASERPVIGGLAGALPIDVFPEDAAYVALGHLHFAQEVGGRPWVRYAGSPIPLALAEAGYPHQVVLAHFEGARAAAIEAVPVPRAVPIVQVPAGGPGPIEEVLGALRAMELPPVPEEKRPWLEVRVRLARAEPALRAQIDAAIEGKPVRLVKITVEHEGRPAGGDRERGRVRELADLDVREVFLRRWAAVREGEPPPDLVAAFDEACAAVAGTEAGAP